LIATTLALQHTQFHHFPELLSTKDGQLLYLYQTLKKYCHLEDSRVHNSCPKNLMWALSQQQKKGAGNNILKQK
jgi:hypothetical protein